MIKICDQSERQCMMAEFNELIKSLWHLVTLCFMQCMLQDRQQESAEATEYHTNRMHLHKTRPKPRLQNPVKGLKVKQSPSVLIIRIDLQFSCRNLSIQSNTLTISQIIMGIFLLWIKLFINTPSLNWWDVCCVYSDCVTVK